MQEELITFETAQLAKDKGFDLYQSFSYWEGILTNMTPGYPLEDGKTSQENYNKFDRYYVPTQSLLQKWLREVHYIVVLVKKSSIKTTYPYNYKISDRTYLGIPNWFETYEEALEKGLQEALKLI